jgi:thioredoxin-dependent peroxiredoxin
VVPASADFARHVFGRRQGNTKRKIGPSIVTNKASPLAHLATTFTTMMIASLSFLLILQAVAAFVPQASPTTTIRSTTALNLDVGEKAPTFALVDQNGKTFDSSKIKKPLVVYFYPADSTPGCTVQATSFNQQVQDIRKTFGAELVGISGQDVASKQKFAKELGLSFSILADPNDTVRKAFAVPKAAFGLFPGRVTYVLDKNGVCTTVYNELADAASHVQVAKKSLTTLKR